MKGRIYFGHPINTYDTQLERFLLAQIAACFPNLEIENPNQKHHADGYRRYSASGGKGMDYYFREVLPACTEGIFLPFRDGAWGAGVFGEAKYLADRGCPICQMTHEGFISSVDLDSIRALTVEETRFRIRTLNGKVAPY
mgnify:FL=1